MPTWTCKAEGVVSPHDVAEELVVAAVVRRVDDALLLPRAPRVRAGGREPDAERVDEAAQLDAPLADLLRRLGERVAPARAHLDLGGDQLSDEVRLEVGALRGVPHVLEAVEQVERRRIEQRELLLDRDREVGNGLERGPGGREELLVPDLLLVAHYKKVSRSRRTAPAAARRSPSSSTCARPPGGRRRPSALRSASGSAKSSRRRSRRTSASPVGKDVRCDSSGG